MSDVRLERKIESARRCKIRCVFHRQSVLGQKLLQIACLLKIVEYRVQGWNEIPDQPRKRIRTDRHVQLITLGDPPSVSDLLTHESYLPTNPHPLAIGQTAHPPHRIQEPVPSHAPIPAAFPSVPLSPAPALPRRRGMASLWKQCTPLSCSEKAKVAAGKSESRAVDLVE